MVYKKIIYSCFAFLFPCAIFCQKFNYNEYAFPDMNIKGMYLTGQSTFQNDELSTRFSVLASSGQFRLKNSGRTQSYYRNHFELFYGNNETNFNGSKEYFDNYSIYGMSYYEKRRFKPYQNKRKAVFKEFNHLIDFRISHSPQIFGNFEFSKNVSVYTSFPLKLGIGKIEPVTHLNVAEFMAEDLYKKGIIEFPLNEDDIKELSEKIVSVTNERVFDRRNAYIYQLTEISNWFAERNIPNTIKSFAILNDNLLNVDPGITRGHGIQNSIGIEPIFLRNTGAFDGTYLGMGIFYALNIQKYFSKYFHHDFRLKTGLETFTFPNIGGFILMSAGYNVHFSPNSRTLISLQPKADYYHYEYSDNNILISFGARVNYFINYRLNLEAYVSGESSYFSRGHDSAYIPYTLRYDASNPVIYRTFNNYRPYYFNASSETNFLFGNISLNYNLF